MRFYTKNILFCILLLFTICLFIKILLNKNETFDYISWGTQEYLNSTFIECVDKNPVKHVSQHGEYIVINNFVRGSKTFKCDESITYTTQGDYTFLDNVPILVSRWTGPISICLYAPGDDFFKTMESIAYLRVCENEYIKQLVTFHVFFSNKHLPQIKNEGGLMEAYEDTYNCANGPPFKNATRDDLYRRKNNLHYPINIGRNIARQAAVTHFVLCSDIELYPSPNFIENFLKMFANLNKENKKKPAIYPLAVFELVKGTVIPQNKTTLQTLYANKKAFWFHKNVCASCHALPKEKEWLAANESEEIEIFAMTKRKGNYKQIESFYVGTKGDPLFDERMSWEGQKNKMQQAYVQCLLNYDYKLLSNSFLVHKPGIKSVNNPLANQSAITKTDEMIKKSIRPQMNRLYGTVDGCYLS